jgi:hypothetical protein
MVKGRLYFPVVAAFLGLASLQGGKEYLAQPLPGYSQNNLYVRAASTGDFKPYHWVGRGSTSPNWFIWQSMATTRGGLELQTPTHCGTPCTSANWTLQRTAAGKQASVSNTPSLSILGEPNFSITIDWFLAPVCEEWDLFVDGNNSYNLATADVDGHSVPHGMIPHSQRARVMQMTFLRVNFTHRVSSATSQFYAPCAAGNETAMVTGIGFQNVVNNELFILQLISYHHRDGAENPAHSWPFRGTCEDTMPIPRPEGPSYDCAFSSVGVEVFGNSRLTAGGATLDYSIDILQTVKDEIVAHKNLGTVVDSDYSHYIPDVFYSGPYIYGKAKIAAGVGAFSLRDNT